MRSSLHVWTIDPLICKLHTSFNFGIVTFNPGTCVNYTTNFNFGPATSISETTLPHITSHMKYVFYYVLEKSYNSNKCVINMVFSY